MTRRACPVTLSATRMAGERVWCRSPPRRSMSASTNEAIVRHAVDAIWSRGDLAVADEVFDAHYVNHNGLIPDLVAGPEAIKMSAALYRAAFPGLTVTIEELTADDHTVALRWTARCATRAGDLSPEGTSSGETVSTGTTHCALAGGRVQESWTEWQPLSDRCLRWHLASR